MPAVARQRSVAGPTLLIAPVVRDALDLSAMSQKRTSRISGFWVGAILSFVSSIRLVVLPIDMIRRPSGVTATTFTSGFLTDPVPGRPWAYGIDIRSRPSVMRQMKSVVS